MDVSFFQEILAKISERGRQILDLPSLIGAGGEESFESLCEGLASSRGEASGVALARRILDRYEEADPAGKDAIFAFLASRFVPSATEAAKAAEAYLKEPGPETLERLAMAVELPRQELLRRLNLAPGGTAALVRMREDLLRRMNTSLSRRGPRLRASVQLLVQPGLPRAPAHVLVEPCLDP